MQKLLITLALVFILAGCATPTQVVSPGEPIAPNVLAVGANQTVQAAQDQLDSLNAQSTATSAAMTSIANAPIIAMTQTAGEFAMQQVYAQATTTSAAATQTAFVQNQIFMAQSTTIAGQATQTAQAAQEAQRVIIEANNRKIERDLANNQIKAVAIYLVLIVALLLSVAYAYVSIKRLSFSRVGVDELGKPLPLLNYIDAVVTDMDKSANGTVALTQKFVNLLPAITPERQDRAVTAAQFVDLATRRRSLPKALLNSQNILAEPQDMEELESGETYPELPFPDWVQLNKWDGNLLPVGTDENSKLLLVDTSMRPHLLYAGRSRSGKTLTGERTEVACLLTQGWNVIVMGKRVDWTPFNDHPNFKLLAVDVRKDAQKYIDVLQIISAQMNIRDEILATKGIGTWERYGAPSTMIVLDDYSGALIRMPKPKANEVTAEVRSIALDGAKFGLSITIGLQDATAQNIDTTTRSQMARIVYSMDNATKSRIALGSDGYDGAGAESLPPFRHFLAKVSDDSNIRRGVGFFLQDREVEAFLASRPVKQNEQLDWVDGVIIDQPALSAQPNQPKLSYSPLAGQFSPPSTTEEFVMSLSGWQARALEQYQNGVDQHDIVADVFKDDDPVIGAVAVAELIERWRKIKGVTVAEPVKVNRDAEIDAQIRDLHAQNVSNTNIVYRVWDKSSAEFSERMARVKSVLSTASASEVREMPQNNPLAA